MSQKWRMVLTAALVILALVAFWNTFKLWTMSDADKKALDDKEPGGLTRLQQKAIRLGLDLQGGIHVVLRVKTEELDKAAKEGAVDRAISVLRARIDGLGVAEPIIQKQGADRIIVDLPGYTDAARAEELIGQTALLQFKLLETMDNANLILARIDTAVAAYEKSKSGAAATTASSSTTTASKGADTTGSEDVLAQLMKDTAKADTAGKYDFDENAGLDSETEPFTTRLEQFLVTPRTGAQWPGWAVAAKDKAQVARWLDLPQVKAQIPPDVQFAWSTRSEIRQSLEVFDLYLLKRKVQFEGRFLQGISLGRENMGGFAVNFKLSSDGAARFAQLTGSNIDKPLAIVLDDKVESAPTINSKIRNSGQIEMGGSATFDEARNMEIVLKAGALPAPVEIIEKNVVGATLGSDSIKKGFYSSLFGLLVVLAYIAFYYRISGLIADIGLLFNVFFLMAILAALGATLTMPGIAGIILTIGISVDSNILIFERIREEMRTGKTVRASIEAGYHRAWVTIVDSHVTTLITAGALFLLGSGPIKGFAVTLFWGVTISLYTAYVITKAMFDIRKQYETLSI
ncbi:MAG: protein translocase subunit SecD [Candidatus Zixiibacteriota bacterium]